MKKNYKENDYITIVIKKDKLEEIVRNYKCFGWNIVNKTQHKQFENLTEIELERPHFIKNKDDLQFLQVNMECDVNNLAKVETNRHTKSTAIGIICGICFATLLTISVLIFTHIININFIFGIILALIGTIGTAITPFALKKIITKENKNFTRSKKLYKNNIKEYCNKASFLIGAKDE